MKTDTTIELLQLYRWMRTARCIDEVELELVARGEAFFQVSAGGHEASASLALVLGPQDFLHCHYRDKALMLARGVPIVEFFDSLLCTGAGHSAGRQMSAHLSAPALNILSLVGPVGNNALQAAGIAQEVKGHASRPVVLCSVGDGTSQQGEVLEAIAEAVRSTLPVFFLVEDNQFSISTRTPGRTFHSLPSGMSDTFHGLPIHRADGRDACASLETFARLVDHTRVTRGPVLCVMAVERLTNHTNADDDSIYRDSAHVARLRETADPVKLLRKELMARGVTSPALDAIDASAAAEVRSAAEAALDHAAPSVQRDARSPIPAALADEVAEYRGTEEIEAITMAVALRRTLHARMTADPRVTLYGQDIEDPKGDVFGVTRGLTEAFPGRVRNAPLSESTIIGTSIGRALAGGRPVAFLQFADFLPLAFNQIASELATMAWRTNGGWRAPVIVMVACGGYRPGLGPFHAQTLESIVAHVPGIDVVMPSTAADAAGMLNAAFASERPTIVFYPKALLNDRSCMTSPDVHRHFTPIGRARIVRSGDDITLIGWGNVVSLCERAASTLQSVGVSAEVIDLRWLSPWDRDAVCQSCRKTRRLVVVHEDNLSVGFGAEVIAAVAESVDVRVEFRRVARPDTFIPCHFGNQLELLPSYRRILEAAAELLSLDVTWESAAKCETGRQVVTLIGCPTDQTVEVAALLVRVGDRVEAGQIIANLEADKAIVDLASPVDGIVLAIHLDVGVQAAIDAPLLTLAVARARQRQPMSEVPDVAHLRRRKAATVPQTPSRHAVEVVGLGVNRGRGRLDNHQLAGRLPTLALPNDMDGIFERTGIESRPVAEDDQDVVSMAADAAREALEEAGIEASQLSLVICCTTTPMMIAPSTACQVLCRLAPQAELPAYDLQAACSGYLYALASAWDFLQQRPDAHVLVLTTETMRRIVDIDDAGTSPLFADAATATVVATSAGAAQGLARLHRPVLGARGEDGSTLRVPLPNTGAFVHMDGKRIFAEAIRRMSTSLAQACEQSRLTVADLDLVVPHQANGRIIDAMRIRLGLRPEQVWNGIRLDGNTSSSSIPLALDTVLRQGDAGPRIGLCAFGAGYTFGGAILETTRTR